MCEGGSAAGAESFGVSFMGGVEEWYDIFWVAGIVKLVTPPKFNVKFTP